MTSTVVKRIRAACVSALARLGGTCRWVDVQRWSPRRWGIQWRVIVASAFIALGALMAMGQVDRMLSLMHPPGEPSGSVTTIAKPFVSADDVDPVLASWDGWQQRNQELGSADEQYSKPRDYAGSPLMMVRTWLAIDSLLFAPVLAYLLASIGWRRYNRVTNEGSDVIDKALKEALRLASLYVPLTYLVVDAVVENGLTLTITHGWASGDVLASALGLVSTIKLALVAALAVPIVVSVLRRAAPATVRRNLRDSIVTARSVLVPAVLVVGVLLLLPGDVGDQLSDVVRSWKATPVHFVASLVTMFLLGALIAAGGSARLKQASGGSTTTARSERTFVRFALVGVILSVAGYVSQALEVLFPIGLMLAAFGALSWAPHVRDLGGRTKPFQPIGAVVTVAAVLPTFALTVAVVRSEVAPGPWFDWRIPFVLVALGATVASWILAERIVNGVAALGRPAAIAATGAGIALLALPLVVTTDDLARSIGSIGLLGWFAVSLCALLVGIDGLLGPARGALRAVRLSRFPLLTASIVLLFGAAAADTQPGFHKAELLDGTDSPPATVTTQAAVDTWLARFDGDSGVHPMFLVASSGGGARAAYWQIVVSDCVFGGQAPSTARTNGQTLCADDFPLDSVAFASGISGGSVGLAMTAANEWVNGATPLDERSVFDGGFLDPVMGNLLFVDLPNAVFHTDRPRDRARALEEAWEHKVPALSEGLFEQQLEGGAVSNYPVLLLNSASVEEGCRINVSVLAADRRTTPATPCKTSIYDTDPIASANTGPLVATRDVSDYLCDGSDLRLSSAALLSARFPLVSPTGALTCGDVSTFAVDGGYVDSSGASTISEMLPSIVDTVTAWNDAHHAGGACVQPVVIQVDNGYTEVRPFNPASRPGEFLAPIAGLRNASGGQADIERQRLAAIANDSLPGMCAALPAGDTEAPPVYFHLYPESHPGVQAPLGWALSETSQDDLEIALFSDHNRAQICDLKRWLSSEPVAAEVCP